MSDLSNIASGLPRNFLRPVLLLLLAERACHGYELLDQASALGMERVDPGGLYRTLRAMEQDGLVKSWWEASESGPARRSYELTDDGLDWLHASAGTMRDVLTHLRTFVERYEVISDDATPRLR